MGHCFRMNDTSLVQQLQQIAKGKLMGLERTELPDCLSARRDYVVLWVLVCGICLSFLRGTRLTLLWTGSVTEQQGHLTANRSVFGRMIQAWNMRIFYPHRHSESLQAHTGLSLVVSLCNYSTVLITHTHSIGAHWCIHIHDCAWILWNMFKHPLMLFLSWVNVLQEHWCTGANTYCAFLLSVKLIVGTFAFWVSNSVQIYLRRKIKKCVFHNKGTTRTAVLF